jgi:hypothetical protein
LKLNYLEHPGAEFKSHPDANRVQRCSVKLEKVLKKVHMCLEKSKDTNTKNSKLTEKGSKSYVDIDEISLKF